MTPRSSTRTGRLRRWCMVTALAVFATPASAFGSTVFSPVPFGGDWAYWSFFISHTDPNTRLTSINVSDLPLRAPMGVEFFFPYAFGFQFPEPMPGSTETPEGYITPSFGWALGSAGLDRFTLVHAAGFQGSVTLYMFDSNAFFHDLDPLRAPLEHATVEFSHVTPEPVTSALLLFGLGSVAAAARRRRLLAEPLA